MSRSKLEEDVLNDLAEDFMRAMHGNDKEVRYVSKYSYGKYSIYKYEYVHDVRVTSTTVAKGLTKDEADGFMKLLKEQE